MNSIRMALATATGALVFAIAALPNAQAQCGMPMKKIKPASWNPQISGALLMKTALGDDKDNTAGTPSIVGMWHVVFTAKTMNGSAIPATVIDSALVTWHSDNTELMNSERPPQDGNFCTGVWEQTGAFTYKLNHFAWSPNYYAPGTANGVVGDPVGPVHFVEYVQLGKDTNHYYGTFTLDAYNTAGAVATSFTGEITATRITINTTVADLL